MRIYIQHAVSKRFIGANSAWVPSLGDARDFHNSESALSFCFGHQLSTIGLPSGSFHETGHDMVWRVAEARAYMKAPSANVWEEI